MIDEKLFETLDEEPNQEITEAAEQAEMPASAVLNETETVEEESEEFQELTDNLLFSYDIEYTEEERKLFWEVNSDPMFKRSTLIFSAVCLGLAVLAFIWRKTFMLPTALIAIAIIWAGIPALIYLIRYSRYKRKTKNLWLHKFHVDIYEEHIDFDCIDDKEIGLQTFFYDDIYRIINMNNRLYLIAGMKKVIILPKQTVPKEIINAILELDVIIQTQPKM